VNLHFDLASPFLVLVGLFRVRETVLRSMLINWTGWWKRCHSECAAVCTSCVCVYSGSRIVAVDWLGVTDALPKQWCKQKF